MGRNPESYRRSYAAWLLAVPLLIPAPSGIAQRIPPRPADPATLKQLSLEELSQIEVTTPSREPAPAFRTPVAIYVITGEDIRRSGSTTLPDALRLAPGIEVARINGNHWSVGVRGFGTRLSRSVLVLIDGRSVYTPLVAGTYWEVQDTLLEDVDRIEVIRGPGGTIWGPNAVNGVINIITKSTKDTLGSFASVGSGTDEQGFINFRYGGMNSKGLSYRIYAKGFTRGPQYHFDGDNFDDWRGAQSGFRMDWEEGDRDSFTLQGDIYTQEAGERVQLSTYTPPTQRTFNGNADLSGGNLLARWTRRINDQNSVQVQSYYDRTNRYDPNFGERRDTVDIDITARSAVKPRQQFTWGVGARSSYSRFLEVGSGLVFSPANRLDYLLSAFFQDDITLVDRKLIVSVGTKLLRTNFTGLTAQPSGRILWSPNDANVLWAAFTRAIRTPSRAERDFYLSSFLGTRPNGTLLFARFNTNPDFVSEQLNGYELGYRRMFRKNLFVDIAAFWNHYHDLFSQNLVSLNGQETTLPFPQPQPPPAHDLITAQFRNDLYGFTTGGEISPEWRPATFWRLRGTWSLLNMNLSQRPGIGLGVSPASVTGSSPRHQVSLQSSFDISKKLQLDLMYRYVSALPAVNAPAYYTGDVRLAWKFIPHYEFSLVGRNLPSPRHIQYGADLGGPVAIRRSVFASIAWRK